MDFKYKKTESWSIGMEACNIHPKIIKKNLRNK